MFIATAIVSALLALALLASAAGKFQGKEDVVQQMTRVGVPRARIPLLGVVEVTGAVGLVVGLFWTPLGVAAATGVVLYFIGAVTAHLRARDTGYAPAAVLALVAVAALVLRLLSA